MVFRNNSGVSYVFFHKNQGFCCELHLACCKDCMLNIQNPYEYFSLIVVLIPLY